jgi:hypothetical protein
MADDMNICPYINEADESFGYRIIYSALGLWCLKSALSEKENKKGMSKNAQSILLHDLSKKYTEICPLAKHFLFSSRNTGVAVFIRNIYEQTGYLLTLDNNYNALNNSGETVKISDTDYLYLGLPTTDYVVNGLGIHCRSGKHEVKLNDFLIRDSLTPEEYLKVKYDECDFDERYIDENELEFFNPFYYGNVSSSWHRHMKSNMTMARKSTMGPYYRVIRKENGTLLYTDDINMDEIDALTGAEFRRLYVALRQHYDNPMQLLICPIDEEYSYIRVLGQLPNREYYYLLMNAWPRYSFSDRNNFIIRNKLTAQTVEVLGNIGFSARKGEFYG